MIKSEEIIAGLQAIVNNNVLIATLWYIAIYGLIISLLFNRNPSNKLMAILFCLPIVSVSVLAWFSGNPFNGSLFAVLAILIIIFGLKASSQPVTLFDITWGYRGGSIRGSGRRVSGKADNNVMKAACIFFAIIRYSCIFISPWTSKTN
jgi:hypothetical protein